MSQPTRRLALVCVSLVLIPLFAMMGCTREPTETPPAVPTEEPTRKPSPTTEFRVELPVTPTPSQVVQEGTLLPTNTPGPTNTPRPTKTPWPTRAPTSAPIDEPGMVYVAGGEFVFGSDEGKEDESPQQTIHVDAYNIDVHPVTCAQYKEFIDATGHRVPRNWKDGQIPSGKEEHPVVWVSWHDAVAYAEWAGKRLPTEIEWERAARGTDGRSYPWGNTFESDRCNSSEAGIEDTSPVDQFAEGASPSGALDMAGNVWEWTADWYDAYRGSIYQLDRFGVTYKVLRGGSWFDGADAMRTTTRNSARPDFTFSTIGFRCAK